MENIKEVKPNPQRVEIDLSTDKFSPDEQAKIVEMVLTDAESDLTQMNDWISDREKDLMMYESAKPSKIENLAKEEWMSDRNIGLCQAICDAYQATLLATCYNIDTIHFQANEVEDKDHKEDIEQFVKWGLEKHEANFFPEVDDFIHNRVSQGVSYFKIYWKTWEEVIDRRIPKYDQLGNFKGYDIKTEKKRFEKGVIENIDDVSDLLMPTFGDDLQTKANLIHIIHYNSEDLLALGQTNEFMNIDDNFIVKLKNVCWENRTKLLREEKLRELGLTDSNNLTDAILRVFPIKIYEWYGKYTKNGAREEYRFRVEALTKTFLSGKPLRKVTRSGRRPFVGGPFIRRPGILQGKSLPRATANVINAINNVFNQKSDFQYFENCPSGAYKPDEQNTGKVLTIQPGKYIPLEDPSSLTPFNRGRSMAWAESDITFLLEMLERLTGSAAYFMSNTKGVSGTATRDAIINEKSETRFGLWVKRIIADICDAITIWLQMYQDWAPPDLGERVLGESGKKLFNNLSVETLRGNYNAYMTPDIISGSRTLQKQIAMEMYGILSQSLWFNPQLNPKGNYDLTMDVAKKAGYVDIETMMPPKPKGSPMALESVKSKFSQIKKGEMPEIDPTDNPFELFAGFQQLGIQEYETLDPEYKPLFDSFMFKLYVNAARAAQEMQQETIANQIAVQQIRDQEQGVIRGRD